METRFVDPHNHVPAVSPDDQWGDSDTLNPHFPVSATILPPKRNPAESASNKAAPRLEEGLRIDSRNRPVIRPDYPEPKLEVTEIDGTVLRLQPEEPVIPKVPRHFTFHEKPDSPKKGNGGEDRNWGATSKQSIRWLIGTGVGVAGLIVTAMLLLPKLNKANVARANQPTTAPQTETVTAVDVLLPLQQDAEQLFRIYARSAIPDDFLPHVRQRPLVEALIRTSAHVPLVSKEWVPDDNTTWRVFDGGNVAYGILEGKLPDFTPYRAYMLRSGGQLQLDWKATTAYSTATFAELEKQQGDPSEIRGYIAPSRFFTRVFPEQDYLSYQLLSADRVNSLWVFARRDSRAGAGIAKLFQAGAIIQSTPEEVAVTLRLAPPPEGAQPNQWLVADLLHDDWVLSERTDP